MWFIFPQIAGLGSSPMARRYAITSRGEASDYLAHPVLGTRLSQATMLVNAVRNDAATLGLIGGVALLWTSLSLFSVLESAFNIVYGRPNRSFLRGKGLALLLMTGTLVTLFLALLVGSLGAEALRRYAPGIVGSGISAYVVSIILSSFGVFVFLVSAYYVLTNVELTVRNVLPGAVLATVLLQVTFQALPLYVRFAKVNPALHTFGGTAILLVWLYVMSNVIVFGAELNWWRAYQKEEPIGEEAVGLA